jgi:2-methylisocitrate lyase-like PEP mutase family enzyme
MAARPQDAATFHALHKELLVLPNAWDAASARVTQDAGAKAIATSSAAVAWSQGYADGHHFPPARLAIVIADIARVVTVPITCDAEGGYSDDPKQAAENITALINAGAVGINLEDGKQPHELHLKKIEAIRNAAERAGVNLYINARTDVYLKQLVPAEQATEETLRRAAAIKEAGASGLFVPGVSSAADISAIVKGTTLPLNVMARPGVPKRDELKAIGVKRISAATSIYAVAMRAAIDASTAFLETADSDTLWAKRGTQPDYNKMFGG